MLTRGHVADRQCPSRLFVGHAEREKLQYFTLARRTNDAQSQIVVFLSAPGLRRK